jgi:AcrR family transcriptional regulator
MKSRPIPRISSRKQPRQARSARLVADILEAAVRVLASSGARRFTTARVAERAGVSVGSLYQYFPNKEAILFRLQTDEWRMTSNMINQILADTTLAPFARLRSVVRAFVQSECAEAELRVALGDAAPLYRDVPETLEYRKAGMRRVVQFMREAIPSVPKRERTLAADLIMMSMETVGKRISEQGRPQSQVIRLANAMSDMLCAYLASLTPAGSAGPPDG